MKIGDFVVRKSYGKDIVFYICEINNDIAILKGITIRIIADSPLEDLEKTDISRIKKELLNFDKELKEVKKTKQKNFILKRVKIKYGRILHLDGDRKYSIKSQSIYKNMGLNVVVKNVAENRQPQVIINLLNRYNPDILVVTGHDGMVKKGHNFNDIYNYRNSKYFIETVRKARMYCGNNLAIFAGACQSYYEGLMEAGANFASSPARILIDFKDPIIVAGKIAVTEAEQFITIKDFEYELRDGNHGISGTGCYGKKIII